MLPGGEHLGPFGVAHAAPDHAGQRLVQLLHGDQGQRPPVPLDDAVGQRRVAGGQRLAGLPPGA